MSIYIKKLTRAEILADKLQQEVLKVESGVNELLEQNNDLRECLGGARRTLLHNRERFQEYSLKKQYYSAMLKLHKIYFVEHPTQADLDNVLSKTNRTNEDNEA
jgi:hypothetical protein